MNRDAVFAAIDAFGRIARPPDQHAARPLGDHFLTNRGVVHRPSSTGPRRRSPIRPAVPGPAAACTRGCWRRWITCAVTTPERDHHLHHRESRPPDADGRAFHARECRPVLNTVRCTLPGARGVKPADSDMARAFIAAPTVATSYTGNRRKLVVRTSRTSLLPFPPSARRMMCDISPCGAVACAGRRRRPLSVQRVHRPAASSRRRPVRIGRGGGARFRRFRLSRDATWTRSPCRDCAIRHFCGAPVRRRRTDERRNGPHRRLCGFYEEQVRDGFRLIADGIVAITCGTTDEGTETVFDHALR